MIENVRPAPAPPAWPAQRLSEAIRRWDGPLTQTSPKLLRTAFGLGGPLHEFAILALAQAVDGAVGDLWGTASSFSRPPRYLERLMSDSSLTSDVSKFGWVLPKAAASDRGQHLSKKFTHLCRPIPVPGVRVEYRRLGPTFPYLPDGKVRVAFCPLVTDPTEIGMKALPDSRFSVTVDGKEALEAKCINILNAMRESVDLLVFPELVLTRDIVDRLQSELERLRSNGARLQVIVAGTHLNCSVNPPHNTAAILLPVRWKGWRQNKMHRYRMSAGEQKEYGFPFGQPAEDREEDISIDRRLVVCDCGLGRVAVLICEDLARSGPGRAAAVEYGVSLLIVPTLDGPTFLPRSGGPWHLEKWSARYARDLQDEGVDTVIINSPTHQFRVPGDFEAPRPVGFAMFSGETHYIYADADDPIGYEDKESIKQKVIEFKVKFSMT